MYNQEIVKRVANADLQAFRKMYIDCAPAVYDCAYDILHDVVRSNMVVSRTFVDIFNFLPQLKKLRLFDEWVYRLTVYHADNLALEDFIRGSEKLETIWHEIVDELGAVEAQGGKKPTAAQEAKQQSSAVSVNTKETNALYSRLREIEQQADAIQREHIEEPDSLSEDDFAAATEDLSRDSAALDEEWTPILFPADDGRDSELHFHIEKSSGLKAYRKTVSIPASKVYSKAKQEENATVPKVFQEQKTAKEFEEPTVNASESSDLQAQAESAAWKQEEGSFEKIIEEAAEEKKTESVAEINDYDYSALNKTAAMGERFERFRAFLDETRTTVKATEPPPAEEPFSIAQAERDQASAEDELRNAVLTHSMQIQANSPRPKRKAGRIVAIVLGSVVLAILVVLILMAYRVLATPASLKGIVEVVIKALQGLFAIIS